MRRSGFTLIEVMISSALVGLVGLAFGTLYASVHANWVRTLNAVAAQNEITHALEHIRRHINQATAIVIYPSPLPPENPLHEDNFDGIGFTIDPDGAGPQGPVQQYYMSGHQPYFSGWITGIKYYTSVSDANPEFICRDLVNPSFLGAPDDPGAPSVIGAIGGNGHAVTLNFTVHKGGNRKTAERRFISTQILARGAP